MKKCFFSLVLIVTVLMSNGQQLKVSKNASEEEKSFFSFRDSIFLSFDLNDVPTGFLKEHGVFFEDPMIYQKQNTNNYINISRLGYLLAGMRSATVNSKAKNIPFYRDLKLKFEEKAKKENIIFLPLIYFTYNSFNPTNVSVSKKKIERMGSKNSDLYLTDTLFVASPSVKNIANLEFKFQLSSEYLFTNQKIKDAVYRVDFGDGKGETEIILDQIVTVKYATSGQKLIKIKMTDRSGRIYNCLSTVEVDPKENNTASLKSIITSSSGSVSGRDYNGASATLDYQIFYAGTDQILDKPFFVIEGFDPFNYSGSAYSWVSHYSLLSYLRNQGYDVICVDYQNGMDYIQRNAYALEALIKNVNQTKNQYCLQKRENVILGLSMGGLVVRYALTDMQSRDENHDTRLYISYDSPHQGANVPLSFQTLVKRLSNYGLLTILGLTPFFDNSQLEQAYNILISPAAQQLLILGGDLHSSFYSELASLGFPNCRNIALANGSMQSTLYPTIQYGSLLAELDVEITGGLLVNMDADCYALDNNTNSRIYYDNFGIFSWFWQYANSLPYDNAPGGCYNYSYFGLDAQSISESLPGNNSQLNINSEGFCFVPTASAFNIGFSSSTLQAPITNSGQTSFNDIFINNYSDNENHIQLTTQKRNWILSQVAIGDVSDCDNSCLSISGCEILCSSGGIFNIQNLPQGATVSWSKSTNITGANSGSDATFYANTNQETGWMEALVSFNGNSFLVPRKNLWLGSPTLQITGTETACPGDDGWQFWAEGSGGTNYLWEVEAGDMGIIGAYNEQMCSLYFGSNFLDGELHATVSNQCGTVDQYYMIWPGSCNNLYSYSFSPNPASTTVTVEQLTVEEASTRAVLEPTEVITTADAKAKDDGSYTVEIWHEKKGKVKSVKSKNKKESIDISKLEKGDYFLHIITPTAKYKEHLLVK